MTKKFYSPLDYVQESPTHLVGNWTSIRGTACNGPWILGAVRLGNILERTEERCASGYAGMIQVISVNDDTTVEHFSPDTEEVNILPVLAVSIAAQFLGGDRRNVAIIVSNPNNIGYQCQAKVNFSTAYEDVGSFYIPPQVEDLVVLQLRRAAGFISIQGIEYECRAAG